jgi:hypothetical protein
MGEAALFTTFCAGIAQSEDKCRSGWGFYVTGVDTLYDRALAAAGWQPSATPRDAETGERHFHLTDPDGHELSFARPLRFRSLRRQC